MITVSGSSFDASALADTYPRDSVERQVLETMSQSAENYRYDTVEQLKFELRLRRETVDAAKALHRSWFSFDTFHKSRCNEKYWDRMPNGGFRLKSGANPAAAISDIYTNGEAYATECATAMLIVFYKAMLETFGESLFNELFPNIYLMNWHGVDPLLQSVASPRRALDVLPGDRKYFENPDVNPKTPEWQGENVIVLPDGLYYGHGVGIKTADQMVRALNGNRRPGATHTAYLRDTAGRPEYKELANIQARHGVRAAHLVWAFPPARV